MYDQKDKSFYGRVIGLQDSITFEGSTAETLETAFRESIDVYLEWCAERGKKPEKTYSGKIVIRIDRQLHAEFVQEASMNNTSLNSLIHEKLKKGY